TDLREWLASHAASGRQSIVDFVARHHSAVRDWPGLHAKTVIGESSAYLGSLNLTDTAHERRIELGVRIDGPQVAELARWFDELWAASHSVDINDIREQMGSIPDCRPSYSRSRAGRPPRQTARIPCVMTSAMSVTADRITRSPCHELPQIPAGSSYHQGLRVLSAAGPNGMLRAEIAEQLGYADDTMIGSICGYYQDLAINDREMHRGNLFNRGCVAIDKSKAGRYWITEVGDKTLREIEQITD
ncbi:MAG: phospholipase D-like domain-containing protein, partial [Patescibacteria group bacterium]|nr:phospholipase D-like domain-containing protein [Patescibacteria group bacterium]